MGGKRVWMGATFDEGGSGSSTLGGGCGRRWELLVLSGTERGAERGAKDSDQSKLDLREEGGGGGKWIWWWRALILLILLMLLMLLTGGGAFLDHGMALLLGGGGRDGRTIREKLRHGRREEEYGRGEARRGESEKMARARGN